MRYELGRCLLRIRLQERGLKQQDIVDSLGYRKSEISEYANNKRIMSIEVAINIAKFLMCSVEDLYQIHKRSGE